MSMTQGIQASASSERIRTGEWFAIGEAPPDSSPVVDSPPGEPRALPRRNVARVAGLVMIAATVVCLVRLATHAPARREILRWTSFGQSDRILPADNR
jgi:hypothetical protein